MAPFGLALVRSTSAAVWGLVGGTLSVLAWMTPWLTPFLAVSFLAPVLFAAVAWHLLRQGDLQGWPRAAALALCVVGVGSFVAELAWDDFEDDAQAMAAHMTLSGLGLVASAWRLRIAARPRLAAFMAGWGAAMLLEMPILASNAAFAVAWLATAAASLRMRLPLGSRVGIVLAFGLGTLGLDPWLADGWVQKCVEAGVWLAFAAASLTVQIRGGHGRVREAAAVAP